MVMGNLLGLMEKNILVFINLVKKMVLEFMSIILSI